MIRACESLRICGLRFEDLGIRVVTIEGFNLVGADSNVWELNPAPYTL